MCTLYGYGRPYDALYRPTRIEAMSDEYIVMGRRSCSRIHPKMDIPCRENQDLLSVSEQGILIKNLNDMKCLTIKRSGVVSWASCNSAERWSFSAEITEKMLNRMMDLSGIANMQITISPTNDRSKCLTILSEVNRGNTALRGNRLYLMNCSDSVYDDWQRIDLIKNTQWADKKCLYNMYKRGNPIYVQQTSSSSTKLNDVYFILPTEIKELCFKDSLQIENGQLVDEFRKPFYLPGTNITARCDEGYGFEDHNFVRELQVTCLDGKTRVPNCSKVRKTNALPGLLAFGNIIQAVISLSMFFALVIIRAKGRRLSLADNNLPPAAENPGIRAGKTMHVTMRKPNISGVQQRSVGVT